MDFKWCIFGADLVAQWIKPLLLTLASHIGVLVQDLAAPLSIQLSANMPEKASEDVPSACDLVQTQPLWPLGE